MLVAPETGDYDEFILGSFSVFSSYVEALAMQRAFFAALAALLPASVDAEIILDDFSDPAEIRSPGGLDQVITQGVGDLGATRELRFRQVGPGDRISRADVGLTAPGEYTADVDNAGDILFVQLEYAFEPTDFTQGGRNNAIFVDFTFEEGIVYTSPYTGEQIQPPGVRLIACCDPDIAGRGLLTADFGNSITAPFPHNQTPYTLVAPFVQFTNRGGGQVQGDFTNISEFVLWLSAADDYGPWQVRIDSVRIGNTIPVPEPSNLITAVVALACVFVRRCVSA
jgi:hypothetical protein